jgi:beta-barrel assembly-enhancing protease
MTRDRAHALRIPPWLLLGLLIGTLPSLRAGTIVLPDIASVADSALTPAEDQRLGRDFMRSLRRTEPVVEDPLLSEYIDGLGQRLASHADRGDHSFHFFLIDQPVINAFAGPGGNIGVYSGLVLATESESELAAVLAHEISHVTQGHLARAFEDARKMSGPTAALLLAAILLGAKAGGDAGLAAAAGVQAAALQEQINFTRGNEQEADRVGIRLLAQSGFDPHAMPVFFERLSKASRLYENNAPEFLQTHPVTSNRIADAMGRADDYRYRQHPDDPDYYLTRAALRERAFSNTRDAVAHFRATLASKRYRLEAAERYGYALALLRDHQPGLAQKEAQRLLAQSPSKIAYLLLAARADAETGHPARALKSVADALELYPGNYPLTSYYAQLALDQGQLGGSARLLDQALEQHSDEPLLYQLRSRVAAAAGQRADAHLFLAQANYLNDQLETAVQQLEVALRTEHFDYYDESKLRARLSDIKRDLKAEKEAKKRDR